MDGLWKQSELTELGSSPSPDSEIEGDTKEWATEGGPRLERA